MFLQFKLFIVFWPLKFCHWSVITSFYIKYRGEFSIWTRSKFTLALYINWVAFLIFFEVDTLIFVF